MTDVRDATGAVLALLASRAPGAMICPSEVARSVSGAGPAGVAVDWRATMPTVHAAVDQLVSEHRVQLSWKGRTLSTRAGPYRIGRDPRGWR